MALFTFCTFLAILLMEIFIFYLFFTYIYCSKTADSYSRKRRNKNKRNKVHRKALLYLCRKIMKYYCWRWKNRDEKLNALGAYPYNTKMKIFLDVNKEFCNQLDSNLMTCLMLMVVSGIVGSIPASISGAIWLQVIFFIGVIYLFAKYLMKQRHSLIAFLEQLEDFLIIFFRLANEQRGEEIAYEDAEKVNVYQEVKEAEKNIQDERLLEKKWWDNYSFFAIVFLSALLLAFFLLKNIIGLYQWKTGKITMTEFITADNHSLWYIVVFFVLVGVVGIIFSKEIRGMIRQTLQDKLILTAEKTEQKKIRTVKKKKARQEEGIEICMELSMWEQDIREMCRELKIKRVLFCVDENIEKNAGASMTPDFLPTIVVGKKLLEDLFTRFGQKCVPAVKCILGHELAHIYYGDIKEASKMRMALSYVSLNILLMISVILLVKIGNETLFGLSVFPILFTGYLSGMLIDKRFQNQIIELRADRMGVQLSGITFEEFLKLTPYLEQIEREKNILYQLYQGYVEVKEHPTMERRIKEVKRGRKWDAFEYMRYMLMIKVKTICGKGWRL